MKTLTASEQAIAFFLPILEVVTNKKLPNNDALKHVALYYPELNSLSIKEHSNSMLARKVLSHFSDLETPNNLGYYSFDLTDLKKMADGKLRDGRDATQEQIELAKEIFRRPGLVEAFDKNKDGWTSGAANWNDVAVIAEDFESLSDVYLSHQTNVHFYELSSTPDDKIISLKDLREAAGEQPSSRHFSSKAQAVAQALLNRPELLRKLLGTNKQDAVINWDRLHKILIGGSELPHRPASPAPQERLP